MSEVRKFGTHELTIEDDLVHMRINGSYTLTDAQESHAVIAEVLAQKGRVLVLTNSFGSDALKPEVRRFLAEWNRDHKATAVAIFGNSAVLRAMLSLVMRAIDIFRKSPLPTVLVATEAEGRAFLAEQRRKHLAASTDKG